MIVTVIAGNFIFPTLWEQWLTVMDLFKILFSKNEHPNWMLAGGQDRTTKKGGKVNNYPITVYFWGWHTQSILLHRMLAATAIIDHVKQSTLERQWRQEKSFSIRLVSSIRNALRQQRCQWHFQWTKGINLFKLQSLLGYGFCTVIMSFLFPFNQQWSSYF